MKLLTKISIAFNLIIIAALLYLVFNGKNIFSKVIFEIMQIQYQQKHSMFEVCPADSGAIVFLGNSITEGAHWNELFDSVTIINRGIGGDKTKGVLNRLDEVIRHRPSKLFICIGTNDLAWGVEPDTLLSNYGKIIERVMEQSPDTRIYIQSILPVGEKVMFRHKNEKIAPVNAEIQKMCAEKGITYIDLYSKFTAADGYLEPSFTNDNLHLMGKGYLHWVEIIRPYIYE